MRPLVILLAFAAFAIPGSGASLAAAPTAPAETIGPFTGVVVGTLDRTRNIRNSEFTSRSEDVYKGRFTYSFRIVNGVVQGTGHGDYLEASWKLAGTTVATLLLPVLILAVPIVDTALVVVVRLLEGRPIYQGGRDHTSHRLVYFGLSERRAVVLLALISVGLGATSLGYVVLDEPRLTLVGVLLTFALLVQVASFLADIERGPVARAGGQTRLVRSLVVHRRRLVEVAVDFALITAAFTIAYQVRVVDTGTPWDPYVFNTALPAILVARYLAFVPLGLYRGVWRYAGARDAVAVVAAVILSEAAAVGFLATTARWQDWRIHQVA